MESISYKNGPLKIKIGCGKKTTYFLETISDIKTICMELKNSNQIIGVLQTK